MNPGEMRDRITLRVKTVQTGPIMILDDYEDYKTIWAKAKYLSGRNFYAARAANIKTDVEFIIRYRTDLDETMRIKFNNEFYNIEGILPLDNSKTYLVVKAYNIKHDM